MERTALKNLREWAKRENRPLAIGHCDKGVDGAVLDRRSEDTKTKAV